MAKRIGDLEVREKVYFVSDAEVPNMMVKVYPSGQKTFVYRYREADKRREKAIGDATRITIIQARKKAKEIHAELILGTGSAAPPAPKVETHKTADDFVTISKSWLGSLEALGRDPAYIGNQETLLRLHINPVIGDRPIDTIRRPDIVDLMDRKIKAGKPDLARKVKLVVGMVFGYAIERGLVEVNPAASIKNKTPAVKRERVLLKEELRKVKEELSKEALSEDTADVIRVLMHTGQRRGEVLGIPWREIDFEDAMWRLPGSRTKNGRPHNVPLSSQMLDLFKRRKKAAGKVKPDDTVFNVALYSVGQACRRMAARHKFPKFGPHDFRRTMATSIQEIDQTYGDDMVRNLINHSSGRGAMAHYNHYKFDAEKRVALQAWSDWLDRL